MNQEEKTLIAVAVAVAVSFVPLIYISSTSDPVVECVQVEDHFYAVASNRGSVAIVHHGGCWCLDKRLDLTKEKAEQRAYADRELGKATQ